MSLPYIIGAAGQGLARGAGRVITSPWFWNALMFLEQEHEIHSLQAAIKAAEAAGGGQGQRQIPGAPEGCVWPPRVGSGEWYDMLSELENEIALAPQPHKCTCCDGEDW